MVSSMTAFARLEDAGDWGHAVWEIRTVNHRYLDISIRLPEELRVLESGVRERISDRLKRGKVECNLRYDADSTLDNIAVNTRLTEKIIQASRSLPVDNPAPVNPVDILRWPGVIEKNTPDLEQTGACLLILLDKALQDIVESRRREGGKTGRMIQDRCGLALDQVAQMRTRVPEIITALSERHMERIRELNIELDNSRTGAGDCPVVAETGRG